MRKAQGMWMLGLTVVLTAFRAFGLAPGENAPDFTLNDTQGKAHKLSEAQGKYVVLEWTNFDCPFVRKHYQSKNMQALQKEYTGKGVVWYTINSSAPGKGGHYPVATWNTMIAEYGAAPTALLLDPSGEAGRAYGARTTPHCYVISPDGVVLYMGAIDDRPSTGVGDIKGARNYVKAALDDAMAGRAVDPAATKAYGCGVKY